MDMLCILGPTACGKTRLAVEIARQLDGEIISADSRQVFRGMDIGTGKDLDDYTSGGPAVQYHLIDIAEPGEEYNVFRFQRDFLQAYAQIIDRRKLPILCGGTGMYIDSVLSGYKLVEVPENEVLRAKLSRLPTGRLVERLAALRPLHNTTDTLDRNRLIRAIEIAQYSARAPREAFPSITCKVVGITIPRPLLKKRISERLEQRIESGLIEEVRGLLESGMSPERLTFYGLEYRFVTMHVTGALGLPEMKDELERAIHRFAGRQVRWFRRMERKGCKIHWIDGTLTLSGQASRLMEYVRA